ncbi:rho guanine nucleotide exchange factor 5 isoform X3 [Onychostoma macrolepis]|uniref:rho guanine nucleotide exchange factor 5 isoform X3 n=1 Tax=Onychostoma macrolepis TaxID=369639 RepID=UPI00272CD050|nr:rho guanine nucleotide exchange factor 5 isoform X3 [Onychostoma macrolepis]
MPGPDGYRELYPCQNFPASKTYCPPKPPLKGEKWHRATNSILRRDVQEKDHQHQATQNSTAAQNPYQGVATHTLVALPKMKPMPKPRLLKTQFYVDQSQSVHNSNVNYVTSASDPACSDGKNNDTHLGNWHSHPKTTSHKSKRVPPSIPVPARPLPKEPDQMISTMGVSNGECPEDVPSVIKYQETDGENLSRNLLETSQRTPTMLSRPGLVDKLIKSPSKRDCHCMCADTKTKLVENLWQDRNIVRDSGILRQLSKEQLKLQEHLYEVVTSEQSYLQSLMVAVEHFQESSVLKDALAPRDRKSLFSSIAKIKEMSQSFMDAMLLELASSVFCDVICDVVHQYALGPFDAYINYIRNMPYQEQTLHNLGKESPQIVEILHKLQEDPRCNRLPLKSFLSLPFQRITRLKVLMENIQKKAVPGSDCEASALRALTEISRLLEACNWQVGRMKQMEEIVQIANKTEFACKAMPLVSSSRWLVKQGDLVQISLKENMFGQRKLCPVLLFLFNDLLLVATRKGLDRFVVHDYVHRSLIEVTEGKDLEEELEGCELNRIFRLVLLHNHRSATSQLLLQTNSEAEKHLWVELLGGRRDGEDTVYEEWDCPQVRCIEVYSGQQQGELSLQLGDMINIMQKTSDGFLEGRRVQDGQRGWFSTACVVEITNEHVQRRHLRQRHHVLQTATRLLKQRSGGLELPTTKCFK